MHAAHDYIARHLTLVEFREFFGEGSCAFGATYTKCIEDRLLNGTCGAESWAATVESIRARYRDAATALASLRAEGGIVVITVLGGLLDINGVAAGERVITLRVPKGYVPHAHATTTMFLSNVYEKVHGEANPLAWTAQELRRDFKITTCACTGNTHIQSDTFFGLRVSFAIADAPHAPIAIASADTKTSIYSQNAWKFAPSSTATNASSEMLLDAQERSWQAELRTEAAALSRVSAKRFAEAAALMVRADS